MGYSDFPGSWPTFQDTIHVPKLNHVDENTALHIDDLPTRGAASSLSAGEVSHVMQRPAEADIITADGSADVPTTGSGGIWRGGLRSPYWNGAQTFAE